MRHFSFRPSLSIVFEYGFNVETAGDHPVWHQSEQDVLPGQHDDQKQS